MLFNAVPVVLALSSTLVVAAPLPQSAVDVVAREPIAPLLVGALSSLIGPAISGIKKLFGRDAEDELIASLLSGRSDVEAREPFLQFLAPLLGKLFGRDLDDDALAEILALSQRDIEARSELDAREPFLQFLAPLLGKLFGKRDEIEAREPFLQFLAPLLGKLFGRDLNDDALAEILALSQRDIEARSELDARDPFFQFLAPILGKLFGKRDEIEARDPFFQFLAPILGKLFGKRDEIEARDPFFQFLAPLIGKLFGKRDEIEAREPFIQFLAPLLGKLFGKRDINDEALAELLALSKRAVEDVSVRTEVDAREPIGPLAGLLVGALPSLIGPAIEGIKKLFKKRDADDDEIAELAALLSRSFSDISARSDVDAREPIGPLAGLLVSALPSLIGPAISGIKKLFNRDADDEEIAELAALLSRSFSDISARSTEGDLKAISALLDL
jgi:hypothetical protein